MATRKPTSTNTLNREHLMDFCGAIYAIDLIGGRWKLLILYKLENKTLRFSELKKRLPNISDRMLTLHLQELERDGLIIRTAYPEVPPRVEYTLSESAQRLAPIWKTTRILGPRTQVPNAPIICRNPPCIVTPFRLSLSPAKNS